MPKKAKISIEEKISAVESYLRGELSQRQAAQKAGVKIAPFQRWLRIYRVEGPEGLLPHTTGRKYSSNQKLEAVKAYLSGEGSIGEVCAKRGIRSDAQFGDWIKEYNAHGDFSSKKKSGGGSCMRQGRETTLEERIQIVRDCIASGKAMARWLRNTRSVTNKYVHGRFGLRSWERQGWKIGAAAGRKTKPRELNWKKRKLRSSGSSISCIWRKWSVTC